MKSHKLTLPLGLLILGITGLHAQQASVSAGGSLSGTGGSASYSIGQVFYTVNTMSSGSLNQGVQHPYRISVVTGSGVAKDLDLTISAYPNPTADKITLQTGNFELPGLSSLLYDIHGRIIEEKRLSEDVSEISLDHLNPSTYFLKVIYQGKEVKTFRIVKN